MCAYIPPNKRHITKPYERTNKYSDKYDEKPKDPLVEIKEAIIKNISGNKITTIKVYLDDKDKDVDVSMNLVIKLITIFDDMINFMVDATNINTHIIDIEKQYKQQYVDTKKKMKFIPTIANDDVAKMVIISPHRSYFTKLGKLAKQLSLYKEKLTNIRHRLIKLQNTLESPTNILSKLGWATHMWLSKIYQNEQSIGGWSNYLNNIKFDLYHDKYNKIYTIYSIDQYKNIKNMSTDMCIDISNIMKRIIDTSIIEGVVDIINEMQDEINLDNLDR